MGSESSEEGLLVRRRFLPWVELVCGTSSKCIVLTMGLSGTGGDFVV